MSSYIEFLVAGGGTGTPGGANTDIQFNSAGNFGGIGNFTYTGPNALGAATNTVGVNILGTLNTSGVVDGAAFFANIINSASGAGTTLFDLQVGGASKFNINMLGDIFLSGDRAISSSTGLTIEQTGDTFGPTGFQILNRSGNNGAVFSQLGIVSVVDFVFVINGTGGNNGQGNIRYERRSSFFVNNNNLFEEFQIGDLEPQNWPFAYFGDVTSGVTNKVGQPNLTFNVGGFGSANNVVADITWGTNNSSVILRKTGRLESRPGSFVSASNAAFELQFGTAGGPNQFVIGDTVNIHNGVKPKYTINTTGAGSAALGANCPATTLTAPYTWIEAQSSDGSLVYIPCWK